MEDTGQIVTYLRSAAFQEAAALASRREPDFVCYLDFRIVDNE